MTAVLDVTLGAIARRRRLWLGVTIGFTIAYYVFLLSSLVIRFGNYPNYVVPYDWFGNVLEIIRATPSFSDTVSIILDEWLLEIGHMNRDYGNGISEWSLYLVPHKVLIVGALGALVATNLALNLERRTCGVRSDLQAGAATGFGALLVGLSSATMSWVVCCSTPSWVVGLAMFGLGVSTSLWLEPLGGWLMALGFASLALAIVFQAWRLAGAGLVVDAAQPVAEPAWEEEQSHVAT